MELCEQRWHRAGHEFDLPDAGRPHPAHSSVVVAEVTYDFTPVANLRGYPNPGAFKMKQTFYARSRKSVQVTKTN